MITARKITLPLLLTVFSAVSANANKIPGPESFDADYFHRNEAGVLDRNIAQLQGILSKPEIGAAGPAPRPEKMNAPYLWRLCRAEIRRGEKHQKKSDKLADYETARKDCERSVSLETASADAHFWLGVAMGRWGETKGILKAMFLIKPIRREMEATLALDPKHGGAHHVLGEMLWQIPGFAGGDKKKALAEFELAVKLSPTHTSNYQPLAEAYLKFGRKDDAIRTLKAVEAVKDPADPAEYPENLADARKLLAELGAK